MIGLGSNLRHPSPALVFKSGKAIEWFVDDMENRGSSSGVGLEEEEVVEKIRIGGDVVPNVCEKPIKFLGRWIRADAKDTAVIEDTRKDLVGYLERLDKSDLTGLQKCWGYQYMVLPKMKWALAIYDIPLGTDSQQVPEVLVGGRSHTE